MRQKYTINCMTLSTQHLFPGNMLAEAHQLRQQALNIELDWRLPSWNGEQFDTFDNRATTYFIVTDNQTGDVVGVTRMVPTTSPVGYMIKNHFAHAVTDIEMPRADHIWETSVAAIKGDLSPDKDESRAIRREIFKLLLPAYQEFGLQNGITEVIGLAIPKIWGRWTECGIPHSPAGRPIDVSDGTKPYVATMPIGIQWLEKSRRNAGIEGNQLYYGQKPIIQQYAPMEAQIN